MKTIKIVTSLLISIGLEYLLFYLPYNWLIFFLGVTILFWEILFVQYILEQPRFKKRNLFNN